MKRRTKSRYYKELSKKNSERAKRGWRVRRLRMMANPRSETFEDIIERHKHDRKGSYYATMEREDLKLVLFHSMNRSDQYDIIEIRPCKWSEGSKTKRINNLSMPKVVKHFTK